MSAAEQALGHPGGLQKSLQTKPSEEYLRLVQEVM